MLKKSLAIILSLSMIFSMAGCKKQQPEPEPEPEPVVAAEVQPEPEPEPVYRNPLTGEEGYDKSKLKKRPVAVVVENHPAARPQWGINTPDIIVEGEVEGGISRMLWLYADYKSMPKKIGPIRSARPSYVKFSEFFDAIFVHWGGSHSNSGYVGGYDTIYYDGVDDIDGMAGGALFDRDYSRGTSSEHTGVLNGQEVSKYLKNNGIRTKVDKDYFTKFKFYEKTNASIGKHVADTVDVTFSSTTDTRKFTYDTKDKKYHTSDWEKDVEFENVLILFSDTQYISVPYKGSYVSYLNYDLDGGKAYYASNGKLTVVRWSKKDHKIKLHTAKGKTVKLNPGKTYIGLASSNYGGDVDYSGDSEE